MDVNDPDPTLPETCKKWVEDVWGGIDTATGDAQKSEDPDAARACGSYLGDFDQTIRPARFMSEDHWVKWVGIRNKYDKEKRFVGYLHNSKWPINWNAWEPLPGADRIQY